MSMGEIQVGLNFVLAGLFILTVLYIVAWIQDLWITDYDVAKVDQL